MSSSAERVRFLLHAAGLWGTAVILAGLFSAVPTPLRGVEFDKRKSPRSYRGHWSLGLEIKD